jgi:UDP-glucose 4-epimerase
VSRYIVTGGAGRLGRSVVRVLADAGHEVVSIDRVTIPELPAEQLQLELLDRVATQEAFTRLQPDGVVHLAAIAVPFSSPDAEIFATNTALAFSVLEGALASGAQSSLFASSPTVIGYGAPGWAPVSLPIDERHPVAPSNGYALSKQAIEALVQMAVRRYGDRMRFGAFRPCYVIAPEEWEGAPTQQGHTVTERLDDPQLASVALFNYVDARDAGEFVLAWLTQADRVPNGSCFFVGAADSFVREPVATALARLVPEVAAFTQELGPRSPVFSSDLAYDLLGWRAHRSWRTELHTQEEVSVA